VRNTLEYKTYILHGDADDNVPVAEARTMRKALTDIGADFVYHEQPAPATGGATSAWIGRRCSKHWRPLG
jgi:predicted esterase